MSASRIHALESLVVGLSQDLSELRWRMARMIAHGPVTEVDNEKGTLRAQLGDVKSPHMQWMEPAGKSRSFTPVTEGEVVTVFRPFGDSRMAFAMAGGFSGTNPKATPRGDEMLRGYGQTSETMRDSEAVLDTLKRTINAGAVNLGGEGGRSVARVGDMVSVTTGSSAGLWPIITGSSVTRSI